MSDSVSNNETVQCNCWQNINYATITFLNEEGNNNFINIHGAQGNNNNTILIIHQINSGSTSDVSNSDKAVQTNPQDLGISQSAEESEIAGMADGRDYLNNSPFDDNINGQIGSKGVQTNNYEMTMIEKFKANNEETDSIANNNDGAAPQSKSASDEQAVDNNKEGNKLILENSQISEILNQSEKNKALINRVFQKFSGDMYNFNKNSPNKNQMSLRDNPVNQSALKHILDIIRRESVDKEADMKTTVDGFSQTDNVPNHKNTQTVAINIPHSKDYLKKCSLNLGPIDKDFTEFLRQSIEYLEEYQNKVNNLYQQYGIVIDEEEDKYGSGNRGDEEAKAGNVSHAPKVDRMSNTGNVANADAGNNGNGGRIVIPGNAVNVKDTGNGDVVGNSRAVRGIVGGNSADSGGSGSSAVINNNDKAYNTVNPIPRQDQTFGSDQIPIMRPPPPLSGNGSTQVRAAGPRQRNDLSTNARYTPYPRAPYWHQDDPRRRPPPPAYECENAQAMHYQHNQHNTMVRQFNGWQAPNAPNSQVFFPGHHHHHHHF